MPLPTLFANLVNPTGPELDADLAALGAICVIPCSVVGTNALTLTPLADTPLVSAYAAYMQFSGVVSVTNTGVVTAQIGALAFFTVYKDLGAGPVVCSGNELIAGNAFTLLYDPALGGGTGGFHLISTTAPTGLYLPLTGGVLTGPLTIGGASASSITHVLSVLASVGFTATPANTTQDQPVLVPGALANDSVMLGPPTLATTVFTGVGFSGYLAAAGTVNVRLLNASTVSISAASITIRVTAMGFT